MHRNPIISLLTVLSLVVALLYPLPLHCCHGLTADGTSVGVPLDSGCHAHVTLSLDQEGGCERCFDSDAGSHEQRQTGATSHGYAISAADCGCITMPQVTIDAGMLVAAGAQIHPPVAEAISTSFLPLLLRSSEEPRLKVGASPPYMAAKAHYTYLLTSTFLI